MEKKYDVSIHFSLKAHSIEEIDQKFENWINSKDYKGQFDFSERAWDERDNIIFNTEPKSMLHHCFLPKKVMEEKGLSTEIYDDFIDMFSEDTICWNGVSSWHDDLYCNRLYMLENLKRVNGVAIFIGDIIEGVKEEYDLAKEVGVDIILIP